MSLHFTHKPNYFLFSQLLIRHIETYIHKHPDASNAIFDLREIHDLFQADQASSSINLEGILNIVDEYKVETISGDQKLIQNYSIDAKYNKLMIDFNAEPLDSLRDGKPLIEPDVTVQE
ncbi:hypothetical protein E2K73_10030 [Acinetobacter sp. RF15A]|uniref:hypothetical protein n=1 Tax=unclassified Acinetobacter TaxID=196816 RepID=UPI001196F58E|nr:MULTISPECIES: hypothetical protein [unclassified Acinetobacter]TSH73747.1 hypothetical protein E2K73_10030 [Acinetobacter sp. RF15A]TSI16409.1 hypothetical protein E2K74_10715 [Acinetobacter sp. RF15B]